MVDYETWRILMENEKTMLQYCLVGIAVIALGFLIKDRMLGLACFAVVVGALISACGVFHYLVRRKRVLKDSKADWF